MHRRIVEAIFILVFFCPWAGQLTLQAQEFKLFGRTVQVHGFASQGFVYSNDNNWLTMNSSQGSGAFTDFGLNMSAPVTDKLRVGAQVYDRNLGQLGQYHPSLDWAVIDYRFKSWLGVRGGKVKTTLGLYNDTQDLDFLHTFALLPQSVYPADLRDASIAHLGGDVYGNVSLRHGLGDLSYTAYAGRRSDSLYSGNAYVSLQYQVYYTSFGGLQYGADLRWKTPMKGLMAGVSRLNEDVTGKAKFINPLDPGAGLVPYSEVSKAAGTTQGYAEYTAGKLRIDSEYRRYVHDGVINRDLIETITNVRGWYVAGAYRILKRLELGSYYSHFTLTAVAVAGPLGAMFPPETNTSLPANHIYDKVITARIDMNKFWIVKVEGHFMDGYADSDYPDGFYPQVNPHGFKPNTNALVLKTSLDF
jgi:hypothetical protein